MPKHIETTIDGDEAYIQPTRPGVLTEMIRKLLKAADDPRDVQTATDRPGLMGVKVPVDLARRAGLVDEPAPADDDDDDGATGDATGDADATGSAPDRNEDATNDAPVTSDQPDTSNAPQAPKETELTPQQKAARTRAEKAAREEAERQAAAKAAADDTK